MRGRKGRKLALWLFPALFFALGVIAFAGQHPVDMENMECITCHADGDVVSNPNVVKEYKTSLHNYTGVGCGNCHGDEKNFEPIPLKSSCNPCHAKNVAVTKDNRCGNCHNVHTFSVHTRR